MPDRLDLIVIGAGPGGYVAAIRAAQLGKRVVCVEKGTTLGGTCLNTGGLPSQAPPDSSELYVQAQRHFARHGIQVGQLGLDLGAMLKRKDQVVKSLVDGVAFLFRKNGVPRVQGTGRLAGKGRVEVRGEDGKTTTLEA